jgi:hypothetical protein
MTTKAELIYFALLSAEAQQRSAASVNADPALVLLTARIAEFTLTKSMTPGALAVVEECWESLKPTLQACDDELKERRSNLDKVTKGG